MHSPNAGSPSKSINQRRKRNERKKLDVDSAEMIEKLHKQKFDLQE